jgi:hypothetical protein
MHLGKTERLPASFVDDALGNCPCSGESRVCDIRSKPAGGDRCMDSPVAKPHPNRRENLPSDTERPEFDRAHLQI